MTVGVSGGNDMGVSLEIRGNELSKIGQNVLRVTSQRESFRVGGRDRPSTLFLEEEKFSNEFKSALRQKPISEEDLELIKKASLGLSVEAGLQVVSAPRNSGPFIEDTDSLADIKQLLLNCDKFVSKEGQESPELLKEVASLIAEKSSLKPENGDLVTWANQILQKAVQRISKRIEFIEEYNR